MGSKEVEEFKKVTALTYEEQGKFFLNAFWKEHQNDAENVWTWCQKFIELDLDKKKLGSDLDEFNAHRFLEIVGETKRVVELREALRNIDKDFNKRMALIEFLLYRFKQSIRELLDRPQGENPEELKKAEGMVRDAQVALESLKKAEAELKAAVDDLRRQEETFQAKCNDLERKSKDSSASMVSRNKAAAELAQLKQEDPLPLRKAKITQEAALRKVEKQKKEAEKAYDEAVAYLQEVRKKGGSPQGALWWMERDMKEVQKYLPKRKQ